jgi:hypothetical protein
VLLVILVLATAAILAGVVFAALGRGGEMAHFPGDGPPLEPDGLTAGDVALYRPPMAFWGYYVPAVEEAFQLIARTVKAKDEEIAALRRKLDEARGGDPAGGTWAAPRGAWAEPGPTAGQPESRPRSWPEPGEARAEPGRQWAEADNIWAESDETWGLARQAWDEPGDAGQAGAHTVETPVAGSPVSEPVVSEPVAGEPGREDPASAAADRPRSPGPGADD